jgi:hypothetical protein
MRAPTTKKIAFKLRFASSGSAIKASLSLPSSNVIATGRLDPSRVTAMVWSSEVKACRYPIETLVVVGDTAVRRTDPVQSQNELRRHGSTSAGRLVFLLAVQQPRDCFGEHMLELGP